MPHPKWRLPLLGDLLGVSADRQIEHAVKLARQLGPIYVRKIFNQHIVFVSGADLVTELVDEERFVKHVAPTIVALRPMMADGLFTAYNDEPNLHLGYEVLRPAFSQAAMRRYHETMLDVTRQLLAHWDMGAVADVVGDMTKTTLEIIGRTGFGYSFDSFRRITPHPFVAAMIRALIHAQRSLFRPPVIGNITGWRADRRNAADIAYLNSVVDQVIESRSGAENDDMLALMLNSPLDKVNIRHQIITFLSGGHETTAGALAFALYFLAEHPEVAARARDEVDSVWGEDEPTFEQVAKLRYVRRIVDEALRLWPTAPAFAREARVDTVVGDRLRMRAGDWVVVLTAALQRDPAVWGPDADEFDPDHFSTEAVKGRPKHAFMPFGTGMRACIGRQFALHEAVLVLGMVLRRYDLRPQPDYRLRVRELLTLKPEGFFLTPVRR
ncbi:cytochrome P450 [Amycolatopsis regifaucium]|uniref:cytochrome P450 n=1 Tax=Amycolatopsis regifaucium TaxID=546365 RepID=UPI0008F619A1|nr:cytochrome P450 [Amycolatopsis regifaucium]SFH71338.1 unspecific monooxygenase [Amycolatopsis regifaucium]